MDQVAPSPIELARRALELAERATPGPWSTRKHTENLVTLAAGEFSIADISTWTYGHPDEHDTDANAAFIAFSRTALHALARAVIAQDEEIKTLLALYPAAAPGAGKGT